MNNARSAYLDAAVATASPQRLLVMLCDRLVLDLTRAAEAQAAGDADAARPLLMHAQEIVLELHSSLKVGEWEGGPGLSSLYDFIHLQLVRANVTQDATITESCLGLARDLADSWRQAALQSTLAS